MFAVLKSKTGLIVALALALAALGCVLSIVLTTEQIKKAMNEEDTRRAQTASASFSAVLQTSFAITSPLTAFRFAAPLPWNMSVPTPDLFFTLVSTIGRPTANLARDTNSSYVVALVTTLWTDDQAAAYAKARKMNGTVTAGVYLEAMTGPLMKTPPQAFPMRLDQVSGVKSMHNGDMVMFDISPISFVPTVNIAIGVGLGPGQAFLLLVNEERFWLHAKRRWSEDVTSIALCACNNDHRLVSYSENCLKTSSSTGVTTDLCTLEANLAAGVASSSDDSSAVDSLWKTQMNSPPFNWTIIGVPLDGDNEQLNIAVTAVNLSTSLTVAATVVFLLFVGYLANRWRSRAAKAVGSLLEQQRFMQLTSKEMHAPVLLITTAVRSAGGARNLKEAHEFMHQICCASTALEFAMQSIKDTATSTITISPAECDIVRTLRDAEELSRFATNERSPESESILELPVIMPRVFADSFRIRQCVVNLLASAYGATKRTGVTLSCSFQSLDTTTLLVRISVADGDGASRPAQGPYSHHHAAQAVLTAMGTTLQIAPLSAGRHAGLSAKDGSNGIEAWFEMKLPIVREHLSSLSQTSASSVNSEPAPLWDVMGDNINSITNSNSNSNANSNTANVVDDGEAVLSGGGGARGGGGGVTKRVVSADVVSSSEDRQLHVSSTANGGRRTSENGGSSSSSVNGLQVHVPEPREGGILQVNVKVGGQVKQIGSRRDDNGSSEQEEEEQQQGRSTGKNLEKLPSFSGRSDTTGGGARGNDETFNDSSAVTVPAVAETQASSRSALPPIYPSMSSGSLGSSVSKTRADSVTSPSTTTATAPAAAAAAAEQSQKSSSLPPIDPNSPSRPRSPMISPTSNNNSGHSSPSQNLSPSHAAVRSEQKQQLLANNALAVKTAAAIAAAAAIGGSNGAMPPRPVIVVAEDNGVLRKLVARGLSRQLHVIIVETENGQEAVDAVCKHGQDVKAVILDINMPVMDGVQAARAIKEKFPEIYRAAYTARSEFTADASGDPELFRKVFYKPCKAEVIAAELENAVQVLSITAVEAIMAQSRLNSVTAAASGTAIGGAGVDSDGSSTNSSSNNNIGISVTVRTPAMVPASTTTSTTAAPTTAATATTTSFASGVAAAFGASTAAVGGGGASLSSGDHHQEETDFAPATITVSIPNAFSSSSAANASSSAAPGAAVSGASIPQIPVHAAFSPSPAPARLNSFSSVGSTENSQAPPRSEVAGGGNASSTTPPTVKNPQEDTIPTLESPPSKPNDMNGGAATAGGGPILSAMTKNNHEEQVRANDGASTSSPERPRFQKLPPLSIPTHPRRLGPDGFELVTIPSALVDVSSLPAAASATVAITTTTTEVVDSANDVNRSSSPMLM